MIWTPLDLLPKHQEATASWWRQLAGASYVWWALLVIVIAGSVVAARAEKRPQPAVGKAAVGAVS